MSIGATSSLATSRATSLPSVINVAAEFDGTPIEDPSALSFGFAAFHHWFMHHPAAQRYRLRRRLGQIRAEVQSAVFRAKMKDLVIGGTAFIRSDLARRARIKVGKETRKYFYRGEDPFATVRFTKKGQQAGQQNKPQAKLFGDAALVAQPDPTTKGKHANAPTCKCPRCHRGFALRRDRRAHVRAPGLCYGHDYMLELDPYELLDRRPGHPWDYAGTFFSDDSEPSNSDDEEVMIK